MLAEIPTLAEHGLAGAVIGALIWLLWSDRKDAREQMKAATDNYREDVRSISAKHDATTREVSDKFIELSKEQAADFRTLHQRTLEEVARIKGGEN